MKEFKPIPKEKWSDDYEEPLPWGQRPSKGSFGKKPSSGDFGKPKPVMTATKAGREKPARKKAKGFNKGSPKIKKFHLVLPKYMAFLHDQRRGSNIDVHHWRTRSQIGRNDFFVVMVDHDYHINTIHGKLSARGYIELVGEDTLNHNSFISFSEWLADPSCDEYDRGFFKDMLIALRDSNFKDAVDTVRSFAEEYNYTTKKI